MHALGNPGKHVAPQRAHCALEWQRPLPQEAFSTLAKDIGTPKFTGEKKEKRWTGVYSNDIF